MTRPGVPNRLDGGALFTLMIVAGTAVVTLGACQPSNGTCGGHGRPSLVELPITWSRRVVQLSAASPTGATTGSFSVSQSIDLPAGATGLRVDTKVLGSRNAPIFPDPVSIDVVPEDGLEAQLTALVDAWVLPAATGTAPSSPASLPDLPTNVGSGIKAVNEFVALAPGRYRLVSASPLNSLGAGSFRVCG